MSERINLRQYIKTNPIVFIAIVAVPSVSIGFYVGNFYPFPFDRKPEEFGNFGSFIGGTFGTIAAGIAIYLSYITNKGQNEQFERQSFENGYFELIKIFFQRLDEEVIPSLNGGKGITFRKKIQIGSSYIIKNKIVFKNLDGNSDSIHIPELDEEYMEFVKLIIGIITFIKLSLIKEENKMMYFRIFYSLLTEKELEFLQVIKVAIPKLDKLINAYPIPTDFVDGLEEIKMKYQSEKEN